MASLSQSSCPVLSFNKQSWMVTSQQKHTYVSTRPKRNHQLHVSVFVSRKTATRCRSSVARGGINLATGLVAVTRWLFISAEPIRGEVMKWLRVQRSATDRLFKGPRRDLIVPAQVMREQEDTAGGILRMWVTQHFQIVTRAPPCLLGRRPVVQWCWRAYETQKFQTW